MANISARIDDQLGEKLGRLCEVTERDPSWHIKRAMREYINRELWQVEEIQKGIDQADRGEFADPEAVRQLFLRAGVNPDDYGLQFGSSTITQHEN